MKIEEIKIDHLTPYKLNAKKHPQEQIDGIAESIRRFGFTQPIVIDSKNVIIIGHGRHEAAKKVGLKTVPCVKIEGLSDKEIRALRLIDNRIAETEWDQELLKIEFEDLDFNFDDFNIDFDSDVSTESIEGLTDPDEVPETPKEPKTKFGEIYKLGNHRLMCGDSTNSSDVKKLMGGGVADMVFTDPPYNVASDSKNYAASVSKSMNDLKDAEWDKGFDVKHAVANIMAACAENVTVYVWTSHFLIQDLWDGFKEWADYLGYLVWAKPNPMPSLSKRHPTWNTELCVYASRGSQRVVNFPNEGHFFSCRQVNKKSDGTHPTQKPIELIEPIVLFSSNPGQNVLDLFGGSGSTMIACEKIGRHARVMELDPKYCDVIIKRWEDFTGKKAELLS
jgi:DNA modification methylase